MKHRAIGVAILLAAYWAADLWSGAPSTIGFAQSAPPASTVALTGAIDVHVHSYPDDRPRSIHAIDVAKLAQTRGMRAIVLKNHWESTAGMAYLVRQVVPGIEVFGGIALNRTVGGIHLHLARLQLGIFVDRYGRFGGGLQLRSTFANDEGEHGVLRAGFVDR